MFDAANLTPHGAGLAWNPVLIWLTAASDLAIGVAYYSIPLALVVFARKRRDLAFPWLFRLFAAFILACGTTHLLAMVTLWHPWYWIEGIAKAVTAVLSIATAAVLWPMMPRALAVPSQEQLQALNGRLTAEIAEREAATAMLRANQMRLQSIYARTPAPLHALDMDERVVAVSDQWLDLLGYERSEVVGQRIWKFHAPLSDAAARDSWDALRLKGALRDEEQVLRHRDGTLRHVTASAMLERDGAGVPWLAVFALTDITGRRRTEEALLASEAHLRQAQKMEAVGQLTGGIAHDFSNMLTAVNCVMELLQKRLPEHDGSRALVASVLEASARAGKLTGQLLAFSRRQRLVPQPLEPVAVVHEMGPLLTRPLGEQVRLAIGAARPGPDGQPWLCLADRNQLESALLNLVLNARAAIEAEGVISITVDPLPSAEAADEVELAPEEDPMIVRDYVAVTVSDDGHGMSEETRRQAFEPFYTTKPVGQGSGLGLSQAYGFARQSGGTVRIESTPGVGTRVTLILPRATEAAVADTTAESPGQGSGETVLLVEDDDTLRDVVVAALQEYGYRVVPARNADEAQALLDRGIAVDLLFTDIMMPGKRNGVELALEFRRRNPGIPVLFATGHGDRKALDRWPGRLALLPKPYSIDAVGRAIRNARAQVLA